MGEAEWRVGRPLGERGSEIVIPGDPDPVPVPPLRWGRPSLKAPIVVDLTRPANEGTTSGVSFADGLGYYKDGVYKLGFGTGKPVPPDQDVEYIFHPDVKPCVWQRGGRSANAIGGQVENIGQAQYAAGGTGRDGRMLYFEHAGETLGSDGIWRTNGNGGIINLEGLVGDGNLPVATSDFIQINHCGGAIVQAQNCRGLRLHGMNKAAAGQPQEVHADACQVTFCKELRMDHFYGYSGYQGLYFRPDGGHIEKVYISNTLIRYWPGTPEGEFGGLMGFVTGYTSGANQTAAYIEFGENVFLDTSGNGAIGDRVYPQVPKTGRTTYPMSPNPTLGGLRLDWEGKQSNTLAQPNTLAARVHGYVQDYSLFDPALAPTWNADGEPSFSGAYAPGPGYTPPS